MIGKLALDFDALSIRNAEPHAEGMGTLPLLGVGVAFAKVPFADVAITTLGGAFAEALALGHYAVLTVFSRKIVVGELRGVLPGVVVGYVTPGAADNNAIVSPGASCLAVFPSAFRLLFRAWSAARRRLPCLIR